MENAKYLEWVKLLSDTTNEKSSSTAKKFKIEAIEEEISGESGMYPVKITDHAMSQIASRLEVVASESRSANNEIFGGDAMSSIFIPSRLKMFILTMVSAAIRDGGMNVKKSKNSGYVEYVYNVPLPKWSSKTKNLMFRVFVENGAVKTGYFNWENKKC
jgi:predicted secreted protein